MGPHSLQRNTATWYQQSSSGNASSRRIMKFSLHSYKIKLPKCTISYIKFTNDYILHNQLQKFVSEQKCIKLKILATKNTRISGTVSLVFNSTLPPSPTQYFKPFHLFIKSLLMFSSIIYTCTQRIIFIFAIGSTKSIHINVK